MTNKTYIIAGNFTEYDYFVSDIIKRLRMSGDYSVSLSDYVYVANTHTFRGLRDIHGLFIGSYKKRTDLSDITSMLDIVNERPYGYHMNLIEGRG